MKKQFLLVTLCMCCILTLSAQTAAEKAHQKRNNDWRAYLKTNENKFKDNTDDMIVFHYLRFEGFAPANDYDYLKEDISKKYGINNYEEVKIPVDKKLKLDAWFVPVENAKGTLIIIHGYGSDLSFGLYQSRFLLDAGYQLLVYNVRMWNSSKTPKKFVNSLENDLQDVGSIITYLSNRPDVDKDKIGVFGFSYGALRAVLAGARYEQLKVVLEDAAPKDRMWDELTPESIARINKKSGMDITLDEYKAVSVAEKISPRALMILHGGKDQSVEMENSELIFAAAKEPKEFHVFPKSAHCLGMVQSDKQEYCRIVTEFLDKYLAGSVAEEVISE